MTSARGKSGGADFVVPYTRGVQDSKFSQKNKTVQDMPTAGGRGPIMVPQT
jgi:hypothetical protein